MLAKIGNAIKSAHTFYIVLGLVCVFGAHEWMAEHDARIRSEFTVKQSEEKVKSLQAELVTTKQATAQKVITIQRVIEKVKTPSDAIAAIPSLSTLPLNARLVPNLPNAVEVDAIPLAQELATCKIAETKLDGCEKSLTITTGIVAEKDAIINATKPSLWKRIKHDAIVIGISGAIGFALAESRR